MGKRRLAFGFGKEIEYVEVDENRLLGILEPAENKKDQKEEIDIIKEALANPIGTDKLETIVNPGEKIVIVTSDITRPMPTYKVMPTLLNLLNKAGIPDRDIALVFARGSHRAQTAEEHKKLAGEETYNRILCVDSDTEHLIHVGTTKHGTPIDIDERVIKADRRICLGNIEYHYFAGYSGGSKAIMPGCSTRAAIQMNHSQMVEDGAHAGELDHNPVRKDLDEAAAMVGVDFILNVVLDEHKKIVHAVAGDLFKAHRVGCRFIDELYRIDIPQRADIVIVSQGGAPKDLNLYQTQKAIDNAKYAVKEGGIMIVIGSCQEGLGETTFENWMTTAQKPQDLIERIRKDFKLGGHKAAAIAMVMEKADIYMVSHLPSELVENIFMRPFSTAQAALDAALEKMGDDATIWAMPYGGSTMPVLSVE